MKNIGDLTSFVFCCRRKKNNNLIDSSSLLDRGLFTVEESLQDVSRISEISKPEDIIIQIIKDDEVSTNSGNSRLSSKSVSGETRRKQMAPMFLFLASSFNVELVYSILKGITQFGYITLCEPDSVRDKLGKMRMKVDEDKTELTFF